MRLPAVFLCAALAGCALSESSGPWMPGAPPNAAAVYAGSKATATEAKLADPLEVSLARAARPPAPADWIVCLRSGAPDQRLRYALFFNSNEFVRARASVMIDRCEQDTYGPLIVPETPIAPPAAAAPPAAPPPPAPTAVAPLPTAPPPNMVPR